MEGRLVDVDVRVISTASGAGVGVVDPEGLEILNRPRCLNTDLRFGLTVPSASAGAGPLSVAVLPDGSVLCSAVVGRSTWLVDMASVYVGTSACGWGSVSAMEDAMVVFAIDSAWPS